MTIENLGCASLGVSRLSSTMANFSDLPTEIWLLISQHLPEYELFELRALNSFFFQRWMDTKWKNVAVSMQFPDQAAHILQRIVDPFVVARIKTLVISLQEPYYFPLDSSVTVDAALSLLRGTLPSLHNIICLQLNPLGNATSLTMLCRAITSCSIARTLQSLSLYGSVEVFAPLGEYSAQNILFENLTELKLTVEWGLWNDDLKTQREICRILASFIRSLSPSLQSLHVWNKSTYLDLAPLFSDLSQSQSPSIFQTDSPILFPNLISLLLFFDYPTPLQSPRPLLHFLLSHSNSLQRLHLRLEIQPDPDGEEFLGKFITELVENDPQFPSLQALGIYPSNTQTGLSATLALIKRIARTLSSLTLYERYLTDEEITQVLDALTEGDVHMITKTSRKDPSKLRSLSMNISRLSVPLLDLLAFKLPQLDKLALRSSEPSSVDQFSFCDLLRRRRYNPDAAPTQDVLHTWKLRDLSICQLWWTEADAVDAVAGAVPALVSTLPKSSWDEEDLEFQS